MTRLENIQCHKCHKLFGYSVDIPDSHRFSVYCAFCEAENVIDLKPFLRNEEKVFKSGNGTNTTQTIETGSYNFPDILKGQQPDKP